MLQFRRKQIFWIMIILLVFTGLLWLLSVNINTTTVKTGRDNEKIDSGQIDQGKIDANEFLDKPSAKVVSWQVVRPIEDSDYLWPEMNIGKDFIIYLDLSQEYSQEYYQTVKQVAEEFTGKLKISVRPFFIRSSALGYDSAVWTECAAQLGGAEAYYEVTDYILSGDNSINSIASDYSGLVEVASIDKAGFEICVNSEEAKINIENKINEAGNFGVTGTPTTFVGVKMLPGTYPLDDFIDSSERERDGLRTVINEVLRPVSE